MTGLFLALILLGAAVPALDCCVHPPPNHGPHAELTSSTRPRMLSVPTTRGCVDESGPSQTPYIETASGGRGAPASSRGTDVAAATFTVAPADAPYSAHRSVLAADSTGPPLWLVTCVSRT
jgi:hypothetical protein